MISFKKGKKSFFPKIRDSYFNIPRKKKTVAWVQAALRKDFFFSTPLSLNAFVCFKYMHTQLWPKQPALLDLPWSLFQPGFCHSTSIETDVLAHMPLVFLKTNGTSPGCDWYKKHFYIWILEDAFVSYESLSLPALHKAIKFFKYWEF